MKPRSIETRGVEGQAAWPQAKRELLGRLLRGRISTPPTEHPLSANQRSLWFLHRLAPESAAYNVPYAWRVLSPLDAGALQRAFQELEARHAILRTTYAEREPLQRVHEHQEVDFQQIDATDWIDADLHARLCEEARRPFDLRRGPVFRVHFFEGGSTRRVLLVVFHHIAYDLWSMVTFVNELRALYASERAGERPALPPLAYQYSDFVRWQAEMLAADGERLWAYWRDHLAGVPPVLTLPTDRPRPPVQTFRGAIHRRPLPNRLVSGALELAQAEQTTLFTVLLAAFQLLLHRLSGQRDVVVGSPLVGRSRPEFENLIGYFLNTLPLRSHLSGDPGFRAFLRRTRRTMHGALEHQDYPLDLLVSRLKPARSAGHSALFQALFVLNRAHQRHEQRLQTGGRAPDELQLAPLPLDLPISQFDLTLEVDQFEDPPIGRWEYSTDLFDERTISRWAFQFEHMLGEMLLEPDRRVSAIPLEPAAIDAMAAEVVPSPEDSGGAACRPSTVVEARTALEHLLASVYQEVLGVERVGVRDSFFDLGGDSFKAAQIVSRLAAVLGVDAGPAIVFESPTIEQLAARVERILLQEFD